jgi:GNAT superfamily N-acetyltransferase
MMPAGLAAGEVGGQEAYTRADETLRFDGAALRSVAYIFLQGRLVRVEVRVGDLHNFLLLRDALFRRHGRGRELSERAERYVWEGAATKMTLRSNFDIS